MICIMFCVQKVNFVCLEKVFFYFSYFFTAVCKDEPCAENHCIYSLFVGEVLSIWLMIYLLLCIMFGWCSYFKDILMNFNLFLQKFSKLNSLFNMEYKSVTNIDQRVKQF
jgi:hypothetical protein